MNDKPTIMSFYENWVDLMEMCNPEEWYQLCQLMTGLRFRGEDVNPKTIENIKVQMAWNLIRPSIKKSNRDQRYNETKRNKTLQEVTSTEFDITPVTNNIPSNEEIENKPILSPSNIKEVEQSQPIRDNASEGLKMAKNNEFEIEDNIDEINNKENSENMGQCLGTLDELKTKNQDVEVIMQSWLEDDDNAKIYNRWITALVQYRINKTPENEEMAQGADRKLSELCNILNIQNKKEYIQYVQEDMDYKNTIIEKNQRAA